MQKISWFSLNNQDASGDLWYSQGYFNAALSTIRSLQSKQVAVFYNREDIDYHVNFCPPPYYQFPSKYNIGYTPWESTKVPHSWMECEQVKCGLFVGATSKIIKSWYIKTGLSRTD
jgi:hypothetical protein